MDFVAHTKVLTVGSGGNGISPAVSQSRAGIDDFVIISKHSDFGGTWFQNAYPGCEVDAPVLPRIPGRDSFEGRAFRSSQWPAGYTSAGDRVAVIGTGSSGMQIVWRLRKTAAEVTVFQRTPTWVLPKRNRRLGFVDHGVFVIAHFGDRHGRKNVPLATLARMGAMTEKSP